MIDIDSEYVCRKASLPRDVLLHDPIIETVGRREMSLENYVCVKEINEDKIAVKCKYYYVIVSGKNLHIDYYNNKVCMRILGDINEISFASGLH